MEKKAQELYPNDKTFCGGVAQIAREAFINGVKEARKEMIEWLKAEADFYKDSGDFGLAKHLSFNDAVRHIESLK